MNIRRYVWPLLAAFMAISLIAFAACNDDDDEDDDDGGDASPSAEDIAAVEEVLTMMLEADPTNQAEADFWLAHVTDEALEGFFGTTREDCEANAEECIGEGTPVVRFEGTEVTGDTAQTTVYSEDESVFTVRLVSDADTWLLNEVRYGPAEVPAGVTAVDLELNEYAFGFKAADITSGNIAFPFENVGEEPHEVIILKTNEEYDLETLIAAFEEQEGGEEGEGAEGEQGASPSPGGEEGDEEEELPPGVDATFFGGFAGPGGGGISVFPEPFEPGTYTLICFVTDPEGTSHAELGMASDFEVPAE